MRCIVLYIIIILLLPVNCFSQQLQRIPHCPSNEIYDIMIDHKGFLWIAHSMGVSRYDGVSFTSFSNVEQAALGATDLVEDNYGRIWYHNFNGQVFYIQNNKSFILTQYDFKKEKTFPRMILHGDELIITSIKGLFVCNTKTLSCRYVTTTKASQNNLGIFNACIINNIVLCYGGRIGWFSYTNSTGLRPLLSPQLNLTLRTQDLGKLAQVTSHDTAFLTLNSQGTIYGITVKNNQVLPIFSTNIKRSINTLCSVQGKIWINTNNGSFCLYGNDTIANYNISKLIAGPDGNTWVSSLSQGLLVKSTPQTWTNISFNIHPPDYFRCIKKTGDLFILCTETGKIYTTRNPASGQFLLVNSLSFQNGTPENILPFSPDEDFIICSKAIFLIDPRKSRIRLIDHISIKDMAVVDTFAYFSSNVTLFIKQLSLWGLRNPRPNSGFVLGKNLVDTDYESKLVNTKKAGRTRAVLFDSSSGALYVSYVDGLYRLKNTSITPVLYKGSTLYTSSLESFKGKIYAATFNKGLFLISNKEVKHIDDNVFAPNDAIVKIKQCGNHLWLFRTRDIELLDILTDKIINTPPLPVDISEITDVDENESNIYLTTHTGLYTMSLYGAGKIKKETITLLYTLVNNTDTITGSSYAFASNQNNLLFKLAIPVYNNAERLHFKYALINGNDDTTWYYTQDAQRDIQFNALKPGHYTFEAIAVKDEEVISTAPLLYSFTIKQPWFNTWWFYTAVILIIITALLTLQQYRLRQVLKIETIRRKISNDLHDDIGSTLSSINVYSQLAKTEEDNKGYINTIQQNAVTIINNLDDLVWNINPKNDVLDNIIVRMQLFAEPLLTQNNIYYEFNVDAENLQITLTPNLRTNLYLLFKEVINNVIKHSHCTTCTIRMVQKGKHLNLTIKDNGKGFIPQLQSKHRNGLHNMQQRVSDIKGSISINSRPGSGTEITVTCRLK
ncbi:MAG TPA: ATP-binding protein [Chitinophagaceae bacterium]|nr:ATP-binding protein [Chitinophagaceae bacterium]